MAYTYLIFLKILLFLYLACVCFSRSLLSDLILNLHLFAVKVLRLCLLNSNRQIYQSLVCQVIETVLLSMWSSVLLFSDHHGAIFENVNSFTCGFSFLFMTVIVCALDYCWLSSIIQTLLWPFLLIFRYHFYSPGDFTSFIHGLY